MMTHYKRKILTLVVLLLLPHGFILGNGTLNTGTLIVSYQTDDKGERLDRVRFWLRNPQGKQTFYPTNSSYVDDPEAHTRMVVIEDLAAGNYALEFLIPNADGYFEAVPVRSLTISDGNVVKIDQKIRPVVVDWSEKRPLSAAKIPEITPPAAVPLSPVPEAAVQAEKAAGAGKLIVSYERGADADAIKLRLTDSQGNISIHPEAGKDAQVPLRNGKMIMVSNLPSGPYRLEFILEGKQESLFETKVEITEGKTRSIHQSLAEESAASSKAEKTTPSIAVTANIPTAVFRLQGSEAVREEKGREAHFQDLLPGDYTLSFQSTDPLFVPPDAMKLALKQGENIQLEVSYKTLGKLKVLTNVEKAKLAIEPKEKGAPIRYDVIRQGNGIFYLPAGDYRVRFSTNDPALASPAPVVIEIRPLDTKEINAYFEKGNNEA